MVAVWEARAEQEVVEVAKNNNNRVSRTEHHRPRLASNRRKGGTSVSGGGGSLETLDDILLSLQNAIVINEEKTNLGENSTEEEKVSKDEKGSKDVTTNKTILHREVSMNKETNENTNVDAEEEKIPDSKVSKGNIIQQISRTKDFPQKTDPGKVSRQNSREFVPKSPRPNKDNPFLGQQPKNKKIEPKKENKMNGDKDLTNDGENTLARALKSLRSTQSFEEKEEKDKIIVDETDHVYATDQADIVLRNVNDASVDPFLAKRQSARLSLQNTLEIVPENEPIDTEQAGKSELITKTENFADLIEKLEKCKEFDSFKSACVSTFVALNKTLEDIKSSLHKEETPVVTSGPPITAPPPPPPPPGPPSLDLTPKKLVISKTSKPKQSLATTATTAMGTVNLMDEIKKRQMIRKGRKSLRSKYDALDK